MYLVKAEANQIEKIVAMSVRAFETDVNVALKDFGGTLRYTTFLVSQAASRGKDTDDRRWRKSRQCLSQPKQAISPVGSRADRPSGLLHP